MNLSGLVFGVRHMLDELIEEDSHWTDPRITVFLNEALVDGVTRLPSSLLLELASIDKQHLTVAAGNEYTFSQDYIRVDYIKAYNKFCIMVSLPLTNLFTTNELHVPTIVYPYASSYGKYLFIYPAATETVNNGLWTFYIRHPAVLVEDTDIPELPTFCHYWLVLYAVFKCLQEDGDERAEGIYQQYIEKFVKYQPKEGK